jgi:hypothetical protein
MKKMSRRHTSVICMILGASVWAQPREIFNGRDLSGWVEIGEPGTWGVEEGELVATAPGNYPHWLRSEREYENYHLSLEYLMTGWCEAGVLLQAPEHGRPSRSGLKIHLRHNDLDQGARSVGAIYDVAAPLVRANREVREWNRLEITVDWPRFSARLNGEPIQNLNLDLHPELRWRHRRGFIGFQDLGCGIRFRNIRVEELPDKERWIELFNGKDLSGWQVEGEAPWRVEEGCIVSDGGNGYLITDESFGSFLFQTYVRTTPLANGGVFYRWKSRQNRGYEAQVYNVPDTTNPTGSIYGVVPASGPVPRDGEWFVMRIVSDGTYSAAFVDGAKVAESWGLDMEDHGRIALQMHSRDSRIEYCAPRIKRLDAE